MIEISSISHHSSHLHRASCAWQLQLPMAHVPPPAGRTLSGDKHRRGWTPLRTSELRRLSALPRAAGSKHVRPPWKVKLYMVTFFKTHFPGLDEDVGIRFTGVRPIKDY